MKKMNYFALAVGIALFVMTAFSFISRIRFLTSSEVATGRVTQLEFGGHHPEIEFVSRDGRRQTATVGSRWSVTEGQTVQIRYNPHDPKISATIDTVLDILDCTIFAALLTAGALITGVRGESLGRVN